jgi:hypothetical protein
MTIGSKEGLENQSVDYIDEMTSFDAPDQKMMFESSGARLMITENKMPPIGIATGFFVIFISLLGFLNGLDYTSAESGLVRPDEFVYAMSFSAPDNSAIFRGVVYDDNGDELNDTRIYVSWKDNNLWNSSETNTDSMGYFEIDKLNPGLVRVDIITIRDGHRDVYSNRVLLSPPALFEPIGFTTIDFTIPSQQEFSSQECSNGAEECEIREIDRTPQQMEHPLMDPGAATLYTIVGISFMGLAIMSASFAIWALKSSSIGLLRTSAALSFFTMGHYYSACLFGLIAFILTYSVKKPQRYPD